MIHSSPTDTRESSAGLAEGGGRSGGQSGRRGNGDPETPGWGGRSWLRGQRKPRCRLEKRFQDVGGGCREGWGKLFRGVWVWEDGGGGARQAQGDRLRLRARHALGHPRHGEAPCPEGRRGAGGRRALGREAPSVGRGGSAQTDNFKLSLKTNPFLQAEASREQRVEAGGAKQSREGLRTPPPSAFQFEVPFRYPEAFHLPDLITPFSTPSPERGARSTWGLRTSVQPVLGDLHVPAVTLGAGAERRIRQVPWTGPGGVHGQCGAESQAYLRHIVISHGGQRGGGASPRLLSRRCPCLTLHYPSHPPCPPYSALTLTSPCSARPLLPCPALLCPKPLTEPRPPNSQPVLVPLPS